MGDNSSTEISRHNNHHATGLINLLALFILGFAGYIIYEVYNQYDKITTCEANPSVSCPKFTCVDGSLPKINLENGETTINSFGI